MNVAVIGTSFKPLVAYCFDKVQNTHFLSLTRIIVPVYATQEHYLCTDAQYL